MHPGKVRATIEFDLATGECVVLRATHVADTREKTLARRAKREREIRIKGYYRKWPELETIAVKEHCDVTAPTIARIRKAIKAIENETGKTFSLTENSTLKSNRVSVRCRRIS